MKGAETNTYALRAKALAAMLESSGSLPSYTPKTGSSKRTVLRLQYDCWADVIHLTKEILKDMPSVEVTYGCAKSRG